MTYFTDQHRQIYSGTPENLELANRLMAIAREACIDVIVFGLQDGHKIESVGDGFTVTIQRQD